MSVTLPRLVVRGAGTSGARLADAPPPQLDAEEAQLLLARSSIPAPPGTTVEHCEPLAGGRYAVGRTVSAGDQQHFVWRIASGEVVDAIGGHPAWLWTSDACFHLQAPDDVPIPTAKPVRQALQMAGPALGQRSALPTATSTS